MNIPQRVRSKHIFLIYENFSSLDFTLEHLKQIFNIEKESDWVYILRLERLIDGKTNILVYVELTYPPDISAERWTLRTIKPKISCSSKKQDFLLRYTLTFYDKFPPTVHILTNMSEEDLFENSVILKGIDNKTKDETSNEMKNETSLDEKEKPPMKERQITKFENYYKQFNDYLESPEPTTQRTYLELERNLRNMTNYRSTYNMPQNLRDKIQECRDKLAQYKSKYNL